MPDIFDQFEKKHLRAIASYQADVDQAFKEAIARISRRAGLERRTLSGKVRLKDYPILSREIDSAIYELKIRILTILSNGISKAWNLAEEKNLAVLQNRYGTERISRQLVEKIFPETSRAVDAFTKRKIKGLNLSDRVYKTGEAFKTEIEAGLLEGISQGKSAAEISRSVRRNLKNPEALFRRVRNNKGVLVPSKAMKAYHPGQGVYKSAYKNAMRLTRSETNMAYRKADSDRYKSVPFIIGQEVKLSNNHKVYDICDKLAGRYGKDFVFTGWHTQCLCYTKSIMASDEDFDRIEDAILNGDKIPELSGPPTINPKLTEWLDKNTERVKGWKSKPLFLTENGIKV